MEYHLKTCLVKVAALAAVLLCAWPAASQNSANPPAQKPAPKPVPRLPGGRVDFTGLWRPADIFLIEDISLGLKKGCLLYTSPSPRD